MHQARLGLLLLVLAAVMAYLSTGKPGLVPVLAWLLAGAGLALLARSGIRRPSIIGAIALAAPVLLALLALGVTIGMRGTTLAHLPGGTIPDDFVAFGLLSPLFALGATLAAAGRRSAGILAVALAALMTLLIRAAEANRPHVAFGPITLSTGAVAFLLFLVAVALLMHGLHSAWRPPLGKKAQIAVRG